MLLIHLRIPQLKRSLKYLHAVTTIQLHTHQQLEGQHLQVE